MTKIEPDLFDRLMSLPEATRLDLLEFLGATPTSDAQLDEMLAELSASLELKRSLQGSLTH